jgi:hypothetical protein
MSDKRNQVIADLAQHVCDRFDRDMHRTVQLVDNDAEVRLLCFAVVATNVVSLCNSLSEDEAPHPLFRALPFRLRLAALITVLAHVIVGDAHSNPWTEQEFSDIAAAQREITPRLRLLQER